MTAAAAHRRRLAYFAWGAVCLIWGTTYLGIRVSLESIPPALMGGIRWTARRFAVDRVSRRARPPASADVAVGRYRAPWVPDARARQRRRRVRGAVGAERARGGDGGDVAILDGDGRGLPTGRRAPPQARRRRPGDWVQRDRAARLAGLDAGIGQQPRLSRRNRGAAESRRSAGRLGRRIRSVTAARLRPRRRNQVASMEVLGTTAYQMLAGGLMMTAVGTLRGEWSDLFFTTRTTVALRVYVDASAPSEDSWPTPTRCGISRCRSSRFTLTSTR